MGADEEKKEKRTLIFTYETLKLRFSNHFLIQDMIDTSDAAYVGVYRTLDHLPFVCGPYRVPFLLNLPSSGNRVWGELYAVSARSVAELNHDGEAFNDR